jgi:CRP-like cAMP-binding protein
MAVLRSQPRMASIIAFNHVEALYLPGPKWKQFLYQHPRAMHALLVMTAEMADRATMKKVESELAVAQQLAKRVMELADQGLAERDGDGVLVLRLHQQDLAELVGARKLESVKRVIGLLNKKGIIGTGRQEIKILRPAVLRDVADGNLTV